jgi:hypothetical protein
MAPGDPMRVKGNSMTETENDQLLNRINELERINRRLIQATDDLERSNRHWKWFSLLGTSVIAFLLLLVAAHATLQEREARTESEYLRWKMEKRTQPDPWHRPGSVVPAAE